MEKKDNKEIKNIPRYYSLAFKKKVVREVECGILSKNGARQRYNIGGKTTILKWCRKYGKLQNLGLKIHVGMIKEEDEKKAYQRRIQMLEEALSNAHLKIESQEIMITLAEEEYGIEIRKKTGTKQQS